MSLFIIIYGIGSLIGFIAMGYDKHLSIQFDKRGGGHRISEKHLLELAVIGGLGVWLGMYVFHHKTRKPKFYIGVPIICMLTLLCLEQLGQFISGCL